MADPSPSPEEELAARDKVVATDITGETHPIPEKTGPDTQVYTVLPGDSLEGIAEKFYGDRNKAQRIVDANRDVLNEDEDPEVGQQLRIPIPE